MLRKAHAKINIGLQIVRKREDGYHDIDSLFHRIALHDTLSFRRTEHGITLRCSDPSLPTDESNLCIAAAKSLFESCAFDGGIAIDLEKTIPYGAGLGGGSSDAAETLLGLNALLDLGCDHETLADIARSLGADIPYFLEQGTAYAKGIGDRLTYFELQLPYWIVLVVPQIHVSTPWAYSQIRFNPALPIIDLQKTVQSADASPLVWVNKIRNDFEAVVFNSHEEVMRIKEVLYQTGADFALMSGSGSSVYGMFSDAAYAQESAEFFGKTYFTHISEPGLT
jgi:4-diphosphocytidyl-2-C-methyl-D-erythritol kinase